MKPDFETVLEAYQRLGSQKVAAQELGIVQGTVSAILIKGGYSVGKGTTNRKANPGQCLEAFQRLGTIQKAAVELGLSHPAVAYNLRTVYGIVIGAGKNPPQKLPMQDIIERYQKGESTIQIAKSLGVDPEVVRRRLNRRGIRLRPAGGWGLTGSKNHQWKGKGVYKDGQYQAQKTYRELLGKPHLPGTVIHHMDENTANNSVENLWVFPNGSCHAHYHQRLLNLQRQGFQADANQIALENGGVPLRRLNDPNAELPSISPPNPSDRPDSNG